ncbi:DUF261 domain-containing protein [Treponema primitia]|uniref:hypothetical protein n=1 Tax=Treponema primitia TaxID=88058 RepID=UPI00397F3EED
MKNGIQTFLQEAGESACYALCIIKIAEDILGHELDPISSLLLGIEKHCIDYNWQDETDNNNFYVRDPAHFLSGLIGKTVTVRVESADLKPAPHEYAVQCWQRTKTGQVITHFKIAGWDPLVHSVTVAQGQIASLRIFTVKE